MIARHLHQNKCIRKFCDRPNHCFLSTINNMIKKLHLCEILLQLLVLSFLNFKTKAMLNNEEQKPMNTSSNRSYDKCPDSSPHKCGCNQLGNFTCTIGASCYSMEEHCDGIQDCSDNSDEVGCAERWDSKGEAIESASPSYDSEACETGDCFKCMDAQLTISSHQVCDEIIDCVDASDECLCQSTFNAPICQKLFSSDEKDYEDIHESTQKPCLGLTNQTIWKAQCIEMNRTFTNETSTKIECHTKNGFTFANKCDGKLECLDRSDECSCEDLPELCEDTCHANFSIDVHYCDGYEDDIWEDIDRPECPKGFDELNCPGRFKCNAGSRVSIDSRYMCDGWKHCDDGSDETGCPDYREMPLSSTKEMVSSTALRVALWVMAVVTVGGNAYVIFVTFCKIRSVSRKKSNVSNLILLLNLAFADFVMGVYLIIICIKSVEFSGVFSEFDFQWRSSMLCSIVGSLAVLSGQASCFILAILSYFRLHTVLKPFSATMVKGTSRNVVFALILAWIAALLFAVLPIVIDSFSSYFISSVWMINVFNNGLESIKREQAVKFASRLAFLTNSSLDRDFVTWRRAESFLQKNHPHFLPKGEISYFGESTVCMPRLYVKYGEAGWEYSFAIITTNFLIFMFIVVCYILIYKNTSHRPRQTNSVEKANKSMQKRIARLVFTDFSCWVPVCIFSYIRLGGVNFATTVCAVSAVILLPINSALNPMIYTSYIEKKIDHMIISTKSLLSKHSISLSRHANMSDVTKSKYCATSDRKKNLPLCLV